MALASKNSHSMMKILGKCMKELFPPAKERRKKSYLKCLLYVIREGQQCTILAYASSHHLPLDGVINEYFFHRPINHLMVDRYFLTKSMPRWKVFFFFEYIQNQSISQFTNTIYGKIIKYILGELIYTWKKFRLGTRLGWNLTFFHRFS